jgi:MFS family permease
MTERSRLLTPAFLAVSLASLAYFIADGITIPILQTFVVGPLGGDRVAVGIAYGAFSLTALILRPLAGSFSDRRGRRPLIVGGAALFAVGVLGHLVATTVPILVVMRLVMGAGEAFVFVGVLSAASDLAPEGRRGEAISYFSSRLLCRHRRLRLRDLLRIPGPFDAHHLVRAARGAWRGARNLLGLPGPGLRGGAGTAGLRRPGGRLQCRLPRISRGGRVRSPPAGRHAPPGPLRRDRDRLTGIQSPSARKASTSSS